MRNVFWFNVEGSEFQITRADDDGKWARVVVCDRDGLQVDAGDEDIETGRVQLSTTGHGFEASVAMFLERILDRRRKVGLPEQARCLVISDSDGGGITAYHQAYRGAWPATIREGYVRDGAKLVLESRDELVRLVASAADYGLTFND